ncbi:MAG: NAD(P)H-dependent oxidoreductase subunit E [Chloroflexi bacterium]|nr:NAD(P)H-dependent oxidoreductase subunit E [Chloroflexota bacterium]
MTIETQALRETIRAALMTGQDGTITVLSSLLAVEDALGYIPPEAIEEVAAFTRATVNDVWGVASFYTNFRFTPPGSHVVEICWGPSCHLRGAPSILKATLDSLNLQGEGETPDRRVTFKYNTCLGACAQAPVMAVDHHLVGRVSPQEARRRVGELQSEHAKEAQRL